MTQAETMRIIADAMEGKCTIELLFNSRETYTGFDTRSLLGETCVWTKLTWDEKERTWYIGDGHCASISLWEILYKKMEIRIARVVPMLSDKDAEFLQWFPKDWYIARDASASAIYIYESKPTKKYLSAWSSGGYYEELKWHPPLLAIKFENEDCYTIQELLDNYKENKR